MTPAMLQFKKIKSENPDCIVFFRMGDFYETFYDDAVVTSKVLDIALTSRDKTTSKTPMAGIPFHALDGYLGKMINAGFKVCLVEQMEDPKKAKGVVKRDVVRIVTPGTAPADLVDQTKSNFLCSIFKDKNIIGFSHIDTSTGEYKLTKFSNIKELDEELFKLRPKEVLLPENLSDLALNSLYLNKNSQVVTVLENSYFKNAEEAILKHMNISSLKSMGIDSEEKAAIAAAKAILEYAQRTQRTSLEHINKIQWYEPKVNMLLDRSTILNLELIESPVSSNKATLFNLINRTETNMGARKLRNILLSPLRNAEQINERLDWVETFFDKLDLTLQIRALLQGICDIERISGKMGLGTINARDLVQLKNSLELSINIYELISKINSDKKSQNQFIESFEKALHELKETIALIDSMINPEPPLTVREGNLIKDGINKDVDELRDILRNGKQWIRELEKQEIQNTGINTLKVKFNRVFGYYIELSKGAASKAPEHYIRKQTLVNAERYITPDLKEKEALVLGAEDRVKDLEFSIFMEIVEKLKAEIPHLQELSEYISWIDIYTNFAALAHEENYTKPEIDNGSKIIISEGRHPIVEWINKNSMNQFITNDTHLTSTDKEKNPLIILTGPNMGGKSTYIRQVAIITLLAQIGSFVPAEKAQIGVVDRIFTRVGASDNLAFGESTFMVEMIEAANILNNATKDSLIILDEVGRGTSTYDGLSIAWAIVEYICKNIGAKTLFATHYHELTQLENEFVNIINYTVGVAETKGEIIFLRKINKGKSEKSFGIHVAKLAGLPKEVIKTAERILMGLEQQSKKNKTFVAPQIDIFSNTNPVKEESDVVKDELEKLDVNSLTPLDALNELQKLKKLIT